MSDRVAKAAELHKKGYNCAQAVACAYCDLFGADEKEVFRMTEGFGLGMGDMKCTCGAVTGAVALAGLKNSDVQLDAPKTKGSTYKIAKQLTAAFKEKNQSVICADLKGVETGQMLRSCPGCIEDACRIVEEYLVD
jgi:C_GCAxxG_C_C family probable redox protein